MTQEEVEILKNTFKVQVLNIINERIRVMKKELNQQDVNRDKITWRIKELYKIKSSIRIL